MEDQPDTEMLQLISEFEGLVQIMPNTEPLKLQVLIQLRDYYAQRFNQLRAVEDLDRAIQKGRVALALTPEGHRGEMDGFNFMGMVHWTRFQQLHEGSDLDDAILYWRSYVGLAPDDQPDKSGRLMLLGILFHSRFMLQGEVHDLDDAISNNRTALSLIPDDDALDKASCLNNLASVLRIRFEHLGDMSDLDDAISNQRAAVHLMPDDHRNMPGCLTNLGTTLQARFDRLGEMSDLDEAIIHNKAALHLTPDSHPDKPACLSGLGTALRNRFSCLGDLSDLDAAIRNHEAAVRCTPDDQHEPSHLANLGNCLLSRFQRRGELSDLVNAISYTKSALDLTPDGNISKPTYSSNLAAALRTRFERLGEIPDLDDAILHLKAALRLIPSGHPSRPGRMADLGTTLRIRFEHLCEMQDLEDAILNLETALQLMPDDSHPAKPDCLSSLGNSLRNRFENLGEVADLDGAISKHKAAVSLTPVGDNITKSGSLQNLGVTLQVRFERLGDPSDLDDAILNQKAAIALTPDGDPRKPGRFNALGVSLWIRFQRRGDMSDLDDGILNQEAAVSLTPDGHPSKAVRLGNLGNSLWMRFSHLGQICDLDDAIRNQKAAIGMTPDSHTHKAMYHNNVGITLQTRFERLGEMSDLDDAILNLKAAIRLRPEGHPYRADCLKTLGDALELRFDHHPDIAAHRLCVDAWSESARSFTGIPQNQYNAARSWSSHVHQHYHELSLEPAALLEAYRSALELLPRIVWLGQITVARHEALVRARSLACNAASGALMLGEGEMALEWLEQGRSIVWGQILQLRTPLEDVRAVDPDLATALARVSSQLERGDFSGQPVEFVSSNVAQSSTEHVTQRRHRAAEEREVLIKRIRGLLGFERFLQPLQYSTLCQAATAGAVVVLNVSQYRCDAMIISSPDATFLSKKLDFTYERALELYRLLDDVLSEQHLRDRGSEGRHGGPTSSRWSADDACFRNILAELWTSIVEPVLASLSLQASSLEQLPRIWWCPTGPLAFLPIHAAGIYNAPGMKDISVSDYAISSYTPSLTALVNANQPKDSPAFGLLSVIQPNTPGASPLPGTLVESKRLQEHTFGLSHVTLTGKEATQGRVLAGMRDSPWVHLSCHGVQDMAEPTKSGILLEDGRLELSEIIKENLTNADFVFLAACQTAKGVSTHPDEAIHLAAGMLSAGYRSVIATMWSIGDHDAPLITDRLYAEMLRSKQPDSREAARALHIAVRHLREQKKGKSFASWVPFIHLGI